MYFEIVIFEIWQSEYDNFLKIFGNMTIRNMTIILNILKYDNLQYDNYFEKIVIFEFENMTKKNLCPKRLWKRWPIPYKKITGQISCGFKNLGKLGSCHRFFLLLSYFEIQIWQFFRNNCHIANCHIFICSK